MENLKEKLNQNLNTKQYQHILIYGTTVQTKVTEIVNQQYEESKQEKSEQLKQSIEKLILKMNELKFEESKHQRFLEKIPLIGSYFDSVEKMINKYEKNEIEINQLIYQIEQIGYQLIRSEIVNQKTKEEMEKLEKELNLYLEVAQSKINEWKDKQLDVHLIQAIEKRIYQLRNTKHSLLQMKLQTEQSNQHIEQLSSCINEVIYNTIPFWKQTLIQFMRTVQKFKNQEEIIVQTKNYHQINQETIQKLHHFIHQ